MPQMPWANEEGHLGPGGSFQGERLGSQGAFGRQGSHRGNAKDGRGRERVAGFRFGHGHVWFGLEVPWFELGRRGVQGSGLIYAETAV